MEIHTYIRTYVCLYDVCVYVCTRVGVHGGGGRELDDAAAVRACVCVQRVCGVALAAAVPNMQGAGGGQDLCLFVTRINTGCTGRCSWYASAGA